MTNENLQVFVYDGDKVRTVVVDGEPWFVLKDICKILGISSGSYVAAKLDEKDKCIRPMDTTGGKQRLGTINEHGLNTVISKCNKKYAGPFRKWIENEVLPSIKNETKGNGNSLCVKAQTEKAMPSSNIRIFNYQSNEVRTVEMNGGPWFVLKDVCSILNVNNVSDVYNRLDDDEKGVAQIDTLGGRQKMNTVNESGLYNVILRSDKKEAKPFRKWVTSEVLPSIRKHGAYMTPETLQAAILNPDTLIQLCQQLKAEQEKNRALSEKNAELAPKAEFADAITASDDCISIAVFAKIMNQNGITIDGRRVGQNVLFEALREHNFLCSSYDRWNAAKQQYVNRGFFQVTERVRPNGKVYYTTKITPAGQKYVLNYFKEFMNCEVE